MLMNKKSEKNSSLLFFKKSAKSYLDSLYGSFDEKILEAINDLSESLIQAWINKRQVFICGNGGSGANAMHIANDLFYGVGACGSEPIIPGLRVEALTTNTAIMTCLANDTGYENIFSNQLIVKANKKDLLIVLSGSGNSSNVVHALATARELGMHSYAIVAFEGGRCKKLADQAIHFPINDMQIAEDTQLIIGHLCMQWLNTHKPQKLQAK